MQSRVERGASSRVAESTMLLDEPPGIDPKSGRFPPGRVSVVLAVGVLATMVLVVAMLLTRRHWGLGSEETEWAWLLLIPPAVAIVVGFLSLRHPLRNAAFSMLLSFMVLFALIGGWAVYYLVCLPLFLPEVAIGTLAGWTLRRHLRARKHRNFAGW
jgi:hypothetical protein